MPTPYKIGVLGINGEGKTIYLSSLYFMLTNRFYQNAAVTARNNADYLVPISTIIGTHAWSDILSKIAGNEDIDRIEFTVQYNQCEYELSFVDYKGEFVYYKSQATKPELIDTFKQSDGIIIVVSDRHYNYNAENFNEDWTASIEKLYKLVGEKPSVLVLTKGDELIEKKGIRPEDASYWFGQGVQTFKANMQRLTGDFDVFVKSAKYMVDRLANGPAAVRHNLPGSPADLAEPLFTLLDMLNKKSIQDLATAQQNAIERFDTIDTQLKVLKNNCVELAKAIDMLAGVKADISSFSTSAWEDVNGIEEKRDKLHKLTFLVQSAPTIEQVNDLVAESETISFLANLFNDRVTSLLNEAHQSPNKSDSQVERARKKAYKTIETIRVNIQSDKEKAKENLAAIEQLPRSKKDVTEFKLEAERLLSAIDQLKDNLGGILQRVGSAVSEEALTEIIGEAEAKNQLVQTLRNKSDEQLQQAKASPNRSWLDKQIFQSLLLLLLTVPFFG